MLAGIEYPVDRCRTSRSIAFASMCTNILENLERKKRCEIKIINRRDFEEFGKRGGFLEEGKG